MALLASGIVQELARRDGGSKLINHKSKFFATAKEAQDFRRSIRKGRTIRMTGQAQLSTKLAFMTEVDRAARDGLEIDWHETPWCVCWMEYQPDDAVEVQP